VADGRTPQDAWDWKRPERYTPEPYSTVGDAVVCDADDCDAGSFD
jgi:hypothetical protein